MHNLFKADSKYLEKTKKFYNQYPYPETGAKQIAQCEDLITEFFTDEEILDKLILEVGANTGSYTRVLLDHGARMVSLDLSINSLKKCKEINPEAQIINGNALELPFPDNSFDHAISIGVLHLTPNCRLGLNEIIRVTAPGGKILILLYDYWSFYHFIYKFCLFLRIFTSPNCIPAFILKVLRPFANYCISYDFDIEQLRNYLADQFWSPYVTFHTVSQVEKWGEAMGARLLSAKKLIPILGYANIMEFQKNIISQQNIIIRRELKLKCRFCPDIVKGCSPNHLGKDCQYKIEKGIILVYNQKR